MDIGPQISSLPDIVTIEVDRGDPSNSNFRITTSHGDLTAPSLYNTSDDYSNQENIISQSSEQNLYIDD